MEDESGSFTPQASIDKMPPPRDRRIANDGRLVPPEDRFTYQEPNNDRHTPTANPVSVTHYPTKQKPEGAA